MGKYCQSASEEKSILDHSDIPNCAVIRVNERCMISSRGGMDGREGVRYPLSIPPLVVDTPFLFCTIPPSGDTLSPPLLPSLTCQ